MMTPSCVRSRQLNLTMVSPSLGLSGNSRARRRPNRIRGWVLQELTGTISSGARRCRLARTDRLSWQVVCERHLRKCDTSFAVWRCRSCRIRPNCSGPHWHGGRARLGDGGRCTAGIYPLGCSRWAARSAGSASCRGLMKYLLSSSQEARGSTARSRQLGILFPAHIDQV